MKKKLLALAMALCLLLSIVPMAAQAETYTVYVVSNTMKVYSKISTSSSVLGTMSYGESLTCLATNSGWAAVKNSKGAIGYCKVSSLSNVNPNNLSQRAYINGDSVPVYRRPETSSAVMMKLKRNSSYTAVAVTKDGAWARLKNGNYYGYVQTKSLSTSPIGDSTGNSNLNATVYISANTLKAYDRPSTSGKSLGTMSYGESMTLLATSNGWARIRNAANAVGYCKLSGLTTTNPNTLNRTVYVKTAGTKVYKKPSTSSGVLQTLGVNEAYTAVAMTADGAWLRLKNGSSYGYAQTKYFSEAPEPEASETTVYIYDTTLTIYSLAGGGSKLGTMSFGESLTLLDVDDGWARVRNPAGSVGYCMYGGLTTTNPNTNHLPFYAAKDGAKLYEKATMDAKVLQTLSINASLMAVALSEDGAWARIILSDGSYAYARRDELSEERVAVDNDPIADMTPRTVYVTATLLSCYASNSTDSQLLGVMSFGESMTCTGSGTGWLRVVNDAGTVGYCKEDGVSLTNPNTSGTALYAQSAGVKVYKKASTSSDVLMTLSLNAQVTGVALSADKTWVRLYNGSAYGYVESRYLATSPLEDASGDSRIDRIVTLAKSLLGIPYKYAAQSPSDGFDCSGFTYYVYKNAAGITLKRTAYTQGYNDSYTKITSRSSLKVGDLVFFNTVSDDDDLCDHVGIYLGGNQFIHASSAKGEVTISSLGSSSSDYYYRTYSWGRRIIS